jgi:integrase
MEKRPFKGKPIKIQEKVSQIIWPEHVFKFLAIVDGLTESKDIKTAIRLMIQLGLRENEALNARWEDFNERQNIYRPAKTKNRETREIGLPPGLLEYLRKNYKHSKQGLIMPCKEKKDEARPHRTGYTRVIIDWAGILMNIRGLHPHSLRATFATAHWEAGTPLSQITSMLGHKNPQTTMIYVQQRSRDTTEAQRKVAQNMGL